MGSGISRRRFNRCDMCNFKVHDGEHVIPLMDTEYHTGSGQVDRTTRTMANGDFVTETLGGAAPRLRHVACVEHVRGGHLAVHPSAHREWEPHIEDDYVRREWIFQGLGQGHLAAVFHRDARGEIRMEAGLRLCAANINRALWDVPTQSNWSVSAARNIWIRYVHFQGKRYVQSLTNDPPPNREPPVFSPRHHQHLDTIFMAQGPFGVHAIIFSPSNQPPVIAAQQDVFWRSIWLPAQQGTIMGTTDGIKVRDCVTRRMDGFINTGAKIAFDVPQPHCIPLRHYAFDNSDTPLRTHVWTYNDPGTLGYSFCFNDGIVAVHAHKTRDNIADIYRYREDQGDAPVWQYLPMQQGEDIAALWHHHHTIQKELYITIVTSRRRIFRLGPQVTVGGGVATNWIALDCPDGRSMGVFYDEYPENIGHIVLERSADGDGPSESNPPALPPLPFAESRSPDDFFCSAAPLRGVVEVSLCRLDRFHRDVIVGMLLRYSDGHQEALGQVRLDSLSAPVPWTGDSNIWFCFQYVAPNKPNVVDMCLSTIPPLGHTLFDNGTQIWAKKTWFRADNSDELRWWFTDEASVLHWQNTVSPPIQARPTPTHLPHHIMVTYEVDVSHDELTDDEGSPMPAAAEDEGYSDR